MAKSTAGRAAQNGASGRFLSPAGFAPEVGYLMASVVRWLGVSEEDGTGDDGGEAMMDSCVSRDFRTFTL